VRQERRGGRRQVQLQLPDVRRALDRLVADPVGVVQRDRWVPATVAKTWKNRSDASRRAGERTTSRRTRRAAGRRCRRGPNDVADVGRPDWELRRHTRLVSGARLRHAGDAPELRVLRRAAGVARVMVTGTAYPARQRADI